MMIKHPLVQMLAAMMMMMVDGVDDYDDAYVGSLVTILVLHGHMAALTTKQHTTPNSTQHNIAH